MWRKYHLISECDWGLQYCNSITPKFLTMNDNKIRITLRSMLVTLAHRQSLSISIEQDK